MHGRVAEPARIGHQRRRDRGTTDTQDDSQPAAGPEDALPLFDSRRHGSMIAGHCPLELSELVAHLGIHMPGERNGDVKLSEPGLEGMAGEREALAVKVTPASGLQP